jgi:regulatory protein
VKITAIKQQVKRQGKYSIFLEGKYAFSLSDTALLESGLHTGQDVSDAQVRELKQTSADDKLYNNALNYVAIRPRSRWEMESYLKRKGCSPALLSNILNKLSKLGLLDDLSFAGAWIANRRLLKPTSRRRLQQELRTKRVPDEAIEQALAEDETDEAAVLQELITRKRKQAKYRDNQKLMQYLAGQGFGYGEIKDALAVVEEM